MKLFRLKQVRVIVALLLIFTISGQALARFLCRADPLVILSNGVTMDIGASISTLPWEVTHVDYVLHVPVGVSAIATIHTPTWLTSQESFVIIADMPPRQYQTITTVYTTNGNADVTADTTLINLLGLRLGLYTASGKEGQPLTISLRG